MKQTLTKTEHPPRLESFDWGRMEWLLNAESAPGSELSLARMTLDPGRQSPLHRHDNCQEALHLVSGQVRLWLSETWRELRPGETVLIPRDTPHALENPSAEAAVLLITYGSGHRRYEALD